MIVKVSGNSISHAIYLAQRQISEIMKNGVNEGPRLSLLRSPTNAAIRRAVHDDVPDEAVLFLGNYNTRGGNCAILGAAPSNWDEYNKFYGRCRDDYRAGVQPLLVLERVFNLACAWSNRMHNPPDPVDYGMSQSRGFVDLFFKPTLIDIGIYRPRYVLEVA